MRLYNANAHRKDSVVAFSLARSSQRSVSFFGADFSCILFSLRRSREGEAVNFEKSSTYFGVKTLDRVDGSRKQEVTWSTSERSSEFFGKGF